MVLNYVWMFFFFCGVVVAIARSAMEGNVEIFNTLSEGMFTAAKDAVMSVGLPLAGTMIFFLGLMKVAEKAGAVQALSRLLNPFLKRLFPEIPERHPAMGEMVMNFSANMLGLDNAATPFGLKAMKSLEELNPQKGTASNSQIMFLVMHTSGLTLIPLSIIALRLSCTIPSKEPAAIFVPCVLATVIATLCSILIVGLRQRIRFDKVLGGWILTLLLTVGLLLFGIEHLNPETRQTFSK
ncbi:MAG TPA: nucleoside recognition domain-containing protein, partial [Chitinophagaceae bacterium]|nr:nucleoside recognition domain-containing protein [Chitinophagaceae bacterium]